MADIFSEFLEKPTGATFTAMRDWLLLQPEFDYTSLDLHDIAVLAGEEEFGALLDRGEDAMPNWLLSPGMHLFIADAARRTGDEDRAKAEDYLAKACITGLRQSGEGTESAPYLITHPEDEYDIAESLGKEVEEQSAQPESTPPLDRIRCTDGTELYFDISASLPNSTPVNL